MSNRTVFITNKTLPGHINRYNGIVDKPARLVIQWSDTPSLESSP